MAKQPETTYRVIGCGQGEWYDGGSFFFQRPGFHSSYENAIADYNELYADPSYDSAFLVEVRHEDWRVLTEFGTEGLSLVYGPLGNFKVEKAAELVLV